MEGRLINNRYRILRRIGEGGMATVYLAEDTVEGNRRIALKTLKPGRVTPGMIESLKVEFQILTRMRHPHLVEVYDLGRIDDSKETFFTLEYVEGLDFYQATATSDEQELYDFIVQLCRALAYIHAHGLIHSDIKPSNILVGRGTGREGDAPCVKVMDFGLAREMTTSSGTRIRGTVEYMAPEVAKGERTDRRTDLYSLGIVLYQAVTRVLPFTGDSITKLVRAHLEVIPPPPSRVRKGTSRALDELIGKLCSKEPSQRHASANEVIRAINTSTGSAYEIETKDTRESYILSARFLGRDREVERLMALFERGADEKDEGGLILVSGEMGIGKTKLMNEVRTRIQLQGARFLSTRCTPDGGRAYGPVIDLLRATVPLASAETLAKHGSVLSGLLPGLSAHLGVGPPPALDPEKEKLRLFDRVARFLAEVARQKTFALFIDDVHWADAASLEMLEHVLQSARDEPVRIFGAYRDDEVSGTPLEGFLRSLREDAPCEEVSLKRLPREDVERLIHSIFPELETDPDLLNLFFDRTGGNPLFVQEMMRSLVEEGVIREEEGAWVLSREGMERVGIPDSILGTVGRRLERLGESALGILGPLAAFGRGVSIGLLAKAVEGEKADLLEGLRELEEKVILTERLTEAGEREFDFEHETIRTLAYDRLGEKGKADLHERIGGILEEVVADQVDEHLEELAHHFFRSRNRKKAQAYLLRAAAACRKAYANRRAADLYGKALSLIPLDDRATRLEVFEGLGDLFKILGELDKADENYRCMLPLAESLGDGKKQAIAFGGIGRVYQMKGDFQAAADYARKAIGICEAVGDDRGRIEFLYLEGTSFWRMVSLDKALPPLEEGLRLAEKIGDRGGMGLALLGIGLVHHTRGDFAKALDFYRRSLSLYEELGDKTRIHMLHSNLGNALLNVGFMDKALASIKESLRLSRELGDRLGEAHSLMLTGSIHRSRGDAGNSRKATEESLSILRRIGDRFREGVGLVYLAETYELRGEIRRALALCRDALTLLKGLEAKDFLASCYRSIGRLLTKRGEFAEALRFFDEGSSLVESTEAKPQRSEIGRERMELLLQLGDAGGARASYEETLHLTREMEMGLRESEILIAGARLALLEGDTGEAEARLALAMETVESSGSDALTALALDTEVAVHLAAGRTSDAVDRSRKLIEIAERRGLTEFLARGCARAGEAWIAAGEVSEAVPPLLRALELATEMGMPDLIWRIRERLGWTAKMRERTQEALGHFEGAWDGLRKIALKVPEAYRDGFWAEPVKQDLQRECRALRTRSAPGPVGPEGREDRGGEAETSLARAERMLELTRILNADLDPEKTLERIMDRAIEFAGAERGVIVLMEGRRLRTRVIRNFGPGRGGEEDLRISESVVKEVLDSGEPILTDAAHFDKRVKRFDSVQDLSLRSIACFPLKARGKIIGNASGRFPPRSSGGSASSGTTPPSPWKTRASTRRPRGIASRGSTPTEISWRGSWRR
ncbi:MAG: protein kinase domain-containing protein [Planctomycetota bacterium]|jgi:predicted ATPase